VVVTLNGAGGAGMIVIAKPPVAESPSRSVTLTEKLKTPITVGVPLIFPSELSESPLGRDPEASENT
jgi:hypothetical protein